jgi:hypothetical protein
MVLALVAVGCKSGEDRLGPNARPPETRPPEVVLSAVVERAGYLILRSPTFRCAEEYCASVILADVGQTFGNHWDTQAWRYTTASAPDPALVEIRITYDPTLYTAEQFIAETRRVMVANPDPGHPGAIVVRRTQLGAGGGQ